MRSVTFAGVASVAVLCACSRGNGTPSTTSMEPLVSVVGCVSQQGSDYVLTRQANRIVGTTGTQGTSGTPVKYRLIDEGHTGVDRYVDRQVQVTGKVEKRDEDEQAATPTIRVTQLSSMGGCQ